MNTPTTSPNFWGRIKTAGRVLFGYDAVSNTRYRKNRGLQPIRSEEVELSPFDRDRLISTLMNLKRNDPVARAISRLRKTDVIGAGITPQPATVSDDYNRRLSEMWEAWSEFPEVTGTMNMTGVQQELADSTLWQGDIGMLLTTKGDLQLIEGNRIGNPIGQGSYSEAGDDKNGVIVNRVGKPTSYKIGDRVNGSLMNIKTISARNFLLYFRRMRPSQWRGVPELAAAVNSLQDVAEYEEVEMLSAKVSASLSAVIRRHDSQQFELVDRMAAQDQDDIGRLEKFEPGSFHYLEPGEDVTTISSNGRPNVEGVEFVMYHIRKVGASVGIPVEMIMNTIGKTSFSASQGLLLQYQSAIEDQQRSLTYILDRLYRWKVGRWIADGSIEIPNEVDDPYRTRWQTPAFKWVNKSAQVASDLKYVQLGAQSLDDVASQFGYTAESVLRRKAQNIKTAQEIAKEFGLDSSLDLFNPYGLFASADWQTIVEQSGGEIPQPPQPPQPNERPDQGQRS